jgi:o-succinylbenzoate synthase
VKITGTEWIPYRLPLRQSWESAAGRIDERHGRLFRADSDDGRSGWGDYAPFPEIGIESPAALIHARECALLDLAAQASGLPLAAWLGGGEAASGVAVNAALGNINTLAETDIEAACQAGFQVLKVKMGLGDPEGELAHLMQLAAALPPGVKFRLDANRAWDGKVAALLLEAFSYLPVEGVEEPLQTPDADTLRSLQANLPFPLALDESFRLFGEEFFVQPPVRRLILKPPRHGGLLACAELAFQAQSAGIECVITSSLESACGLTAIAHLAAAVAPESVHGLATAHWFAHDTGRPPEIAHGRLLLPHSPGIGFLPDIS